MGTATATVGFYSTTSSVIRSANLVAASIKAVISDTNVWYNSATQNGVLYVVLQARDINGNVVATCVEHYSLHLSQCKLFRFCQQQLYV